MHLHVVGQGLKAVGEAGRNVELALVPGRKLKPLPSPVGRRVRPDVNNDIKDRASYATDQLCLSVGRRLKMQPAQCSAFFRE